MPDKKNKKKKGKFKDISDRIENPFSLPLDSGEIGVWLEIRKKEKLLNKEQEKLDTRKQDIQDIKNAFLSGISLRRKFDPETAKKYRISDNGRNLELLEEYKNRKLKVLQEPEDGK